MQSVHIPVSFKSPFIALFDNFCFSVFRGCKVDLVCFVVVLLVCRREMIARAPRGQARKTSAKTRIAILNITKLYFAFSVRLSAVY